MFQKLSILVLAIILFLCNVPTGSANVIYVDAEKGYYVDERNQIEKEAHKVDDALINGLEVYPSATVLPFNKYIQQERREHQTPYIPNYNVYYSERRAYSHTKKQFIDVYCSGTKNSNGMDCFNDDYAVTFVKVENWSYGVLKAPIKAARHGRKPVLFLMVHNIGLDAEYMSEVKAWSEKAKLPIIFATIDTYIPTDWI